MEENGGTPNERRDFKMANVAKFKKADVNAMLAHYDRRTGEDYRYRKNQDIDKTRTHLNYDVHTGQTADDERTGITQRQRLEQRLSEVKHRDFKRFDDNWFCNWVITLPENVPADKAKDFFQHAYDFCCERYGKENVISAWVHMDETTPHMHFAFVPVMKNNDGTERLCAKQRISRLELTKFHPEMQKYVEEQMGQEVGILNGATAGGNLTITELKMREALKQLAEVEARTGGLETAQPIIEDTLKMMSEVTEIYRKLDKDLQAKKWFGDDDKAKMQALTKELDEIKTAAETASKTVRTLMQTLKGMNGNVNKHLDDVFARLKEVEKSAQRRIKRTETKLKRREERIEQREKNLDAEVERRVQEQLETLDRPIKQKKAEAEALDEEIRLKRQQLSETDTELWCNQGYLRTAQANQERFAQTLERWRKGNESKISQSAVYEKR